MGFWGTGSGVGSYRWGLLGKLSIEPVSEALQQCVPASDNDTPIQALRAGRRSEPRGTAPQPCLPTSPGPLCPASAPAWPHRANVNVTHADAGGHHVAHTQHGIPRQALQREVTGAVGPLPFPQSLQSFPASPTPQDPRTAASTHPSPCHTAKP